jgi:hypothetical protein
LPEIKLGKLPDRAPVKITFTASAELNHQLLAYAEAYQAAYGTVESVTELVPFMLSAFMEADIEFRKRRRR